MSVKRKRILSWLASVAVAFTGVLGAAARADTPPATGSVTGVVLDANTALPLGGALINVIGPSNGSAVSTANGRFRIDGLKAGSYVLRIQLPGYQTTVSDQIPIASGMLQDVTLSMSRVASGSSTVRTLGRTTIHASSSLASSTIVVKQANTEVIERSGNYRIADYLRTLPQINASGTAAGGSDNPAPGDDLYIDIRGIGSLETEALIDGHPIGYGINRGKNFGYDFDTAPTFAFRNVDVVYGSGVSGLMPYSSIGGVVNMHTLTPTPQNEANLTEGWGTFDKLVTTFNATGTYQRWGYAMALGTQGLDGPYKNDYFFQPSAAFDPSAPAGTLAHDSGIYKDDTSMVNRGMFGKIRYAIGNMANPGYLTLSAMSNYYWDDKTGNGDQDFLPYDTALAIGQSSLASYTAPTNVPPFTASNPQPCGAGKFTPTNANGAPWGYGPNGQPDGGTPCVTPQQYASTASGLQGAGTTWQAFTASDYNVRYDQPLGKTTLSVDGFTNYWYQHYDRTYQLPFFVVPGDNPFWLEPQVNITGGAVEDALNGQVNDIGLGVAYNNYAYLFRQNQTSPVLSGASVTAPSPVVHDESLYIQDVYHPAKGNYRIYFNGAEVHSTITHSTYFDPRLAFVDNLGHNNTLRVAGGVTAVQPYATMIDLPFAPIAQGALNGALNCTGLTSIGNLANPNLQPERANDQEISIGHNFFQDSQLQLTLYNENIPNKLFQAVIPVVGLPPGIIDSTTLNSFATAINSKCGTTGLNGVGVFSWANIGHMLAQGLDFNGRVRATHAMFFDFDYSTESVVLKSIPTPILQNNLTYIIGSQLPAVPLHKGLVAVDYTFPYNIDLRLQQTFVATNNTKNLTAYNYGDLVITAPVGHYGTANLGVSNVWDQYAFYNGYIGHGVPLALNQYATPSNYTPLIGAQATEEFGVPYRQLFISYTFHAH